MTECIPFSTAGDSINSAYPALTLVTSAYYEFGEPAWLVAVELTSGVLLTATAGDVAIALLIEKAASGAASGGGKLLAPHVYKSGVAGVLSLASGKYFGQGAAIPFEKGERVGIYCAVPNSAAIKLSGAAHLTFERR